MNDDTDDPIINALLEECLGNKRPPDLKQSILNRLDDSLDSAKQLAWNEAVAAASMPKIDEIIAQIPAAAPSFATNVSKDPQLDEERLAFRLRQEQEWLERSSHWKERDKRLWMGWWSSLAGVLVIGIMWYTLHLTRQANRIELSDRNSLPSEVPSVPREGGSTRQTTNDLAKVADPERTMGERAQEPEVVSGSALPFGPDAKSARHNVTPEPRLETEKLAETTVIEILDRQFLDWWNQQQIVPQPQVASEVWLARATRKLVGRAPTESERERALGWTEKTERLTWIDEMVASDEFAQHWGAWLAQQWLPSESTSVVRRQFQEWLTRSIAKSEPIYRIQDALLDIDPSGRMSSSTEAKPEWLWLSQSARVGSTQFADRFCRVMLDQPLACSRCHESRFGGRSEYWGFVSLLSVIQVRTSGNRADQIRVGPVQRQYYEESNGTLRAAEAAFPDGQRMDSMESAALANLRGWLVQSPARRQAFVNRVWEAMYGRPLVPAYGLGRDEGPSERIDLRDFLADQWTAQGEDLQRLVAWLASADLFAQPTQEWDESQYLLATETTLQAQRMADRRFASYREPGLKGEAGLQELVACLQETPAADRSINLLGQAASNPRVVPESRSMINPLTARHTAFVLHSEQLDQVLEDQLQRWDRAKLDWDGKLQHAMWLVQGQEPSPAVRHWAKEVLNCTDGDELQALRRVLLVELGFL